jgi:hypothetical protein
MYLFLGFSSKIDVIVLFQFIIIMVFILCTMILLHACDQAFTAVVKKTEDLYMFGTPGP